MNMIANPRMRGAVSARADASDPNTILASLAKTFEEFKAANEEKLSGIDRKFADVVQADKVDKINNEITALTKALDDVNMAMASLRVGGGGTGAPDPDKAAHAAAFDKFFRKGADNGLADLEVKAALTTQSDPDGGYSVPTQTESTIDRVLGTMSALRGLSRVMNISTDEHKKLVNVGGTTSGWVGEEDTRPNTENPTVREILINVHEIYAQPLATQKTLDDAEINIEQWLADEIATEFAEQEGAAFITGNGVKKPRGILTYNTAENASYEWGKIGYKVTGHASGFAATDPADAFISLFYSLKPGYRSNASFLTSDAVMETIRKMKDGDDTYLWAPPTMDMPARILGKPVYTDDNMNALGSNAFPVAFGDWSRGYLIADRVGIRVLRDPFTQKPYIKFYTTKRVGGGVVNFEAIKLLKCST
ncbi:MAG: phage major capsid protein [Hyphomicrobiales bacterium]